jgi:succinate dehydrogenase / fumarate reductase cytochrome b subunit
MQKPLSPHLQIYRPQLTSILSILHRFTGLGFVIALIITCAWLYALSEGEIAFHNFCAWLNQPPIKTFLYLILACVYYHSLNGIRYLMWSLGKGFALHTVYNSGWIVCALVFALIVMTVFLV